MAKNHGTREVRESYKAQNDLCTVNGQRFTLKAPPIICSSRQFQIVLLFSKITNKA